MAGFASRQCEQEHFWPELLLVSFTDGVNLWAQYCWVWDSIRAVGVLAPSPFVALGLCYARQFSNTSSHENIFSRYIWWELPRTLRADRNVMKCPEAQICGHLFLPMPSSLRVWEMILPYISYEACRMTVESKFTSLQLAVFSFVQGQSFPESVLPGGLCSCENSPNHWVSGEENWCSVWFCWWSNCSDDLVVGSDPNFTGVSTDLEPGDREQCRKPNHWIVTGDPEGLYSLT